MKWEEFRCFVNVIQNWKYLHDCFVFYTNSFAPKSLRSTRALIWLVVLIMQITNNKEVTNIWESFETKRATLKTIVDLSNRNYHFLEYYELFHCFQSVEPFVNVDLYNILEINWITHSKLNLNLVNVQQNDNPPIDLFRRLEHQTFARWH